MDIIWEFDLFYCAPVRTCITSLLDMAINVNWFIKITRSFGSGFQNQRIAKPNVRLIIIESRSKQRFITDQIGNTLVCELWLIVFFLYVNIVLIVYNVSGTIWAWSSRDSDMFLIFLCRERHLLMLYVAIIGHADPWIFSVSASLSSENSDWVENSIDPREISIASTLCWASFRLTVRSISGKSSQPQSCSCSNDSIR
jgi:hypothetical protein